MKCRESKTEQQNNSKKKKKFLKLTLSDIKTYKTVITKIMYFGTMLRQQISGKTLKFQKQTRMEIEF